MANQTIQGATNVGNVGGSELLPLADTDGTPKNVSIDQIKNFILSALLGAAGVNSASGVSFLVKVVINNTTYLRNISIDDVLSAAESAIFGNAAAEILSNAAVFAVKDGSACKTITYAKLVELLSASTTISIPALNAASTLADSNLVLLDQSGNVKATLGTLRAYILAGLSAYLGNLSNEIPDDAPITGSAELLVRNAGAAYRVSISDLKSQFGDVYGPASRTENYVPQWDSSGKLKTGKAINSGALVTDGTSLVTDGAVKAALSALETSLTNTFSAATIVRLPNGATAGNIPVYGNDNTLGAGYSVVTTLRAANLASDAALATEKAIRTAIANAISSLQTESQVQALISAAISDSGLIERPSSVTAGGIPVFLSNGNLDEGYSVQTTVRSNGNATDDAIPTEKAVRDELTTLAFAIDGKAASSHSHSAATTSAAGFMSAADKTKLEATPSFATLSEVGSDTLADNDTFPLVHGSAWVTAKLSRLWAYISAKLSVATSSAAGLLPALSGNSSQFLKGDGTWGVPAGSSAFGGTDGETAGSAGLVPAPATTDANKFLNSNGNWESIEAAAAEDVAPEVLAIVRYDTLFVPAAAMVPSASNGATASAVAFTDTKRDTLAFGTSADNSAEFDVALPDDWNNGSLKAKFYWTCNDSGATANTNVKWLVGCVGTQDGGSVSTAPSNYEDVTDALSQVNNVQITPATDAFAPNGNSGAGNLLHFVVKRDNTYAPTSPLAKDALLLGVAIQFARTSTLAPWSNS